MRLGTVYLVGAGPGDPQLLTLKARDLISAADCIIYDYLVNPEILKHATPYAEMVFAGKQCGKCAMKQETINALMVTKASEYQVVVRLKGGDPFVFGRGGEEAEALATAGVPWQIVPGVSAGTAVAAYAGIPVTHRGISSSVAFVTGHEDPDKPSASIRWDLLARSVDTIVVFMGVGRIAEISQKLILHGRNRETPVAVIRGGTYEDQDVQVCQLADVGRMVEEEQLRPPALIVIGEVVNLSRQMQWFAPELAATLEEW